MLSESAVFLKKQRQAKCDAISRARNIRLKIYWIPIAFFMTLIIAALPIAKTTKIVPITQATIAFFAKPVFSGLPAEVSHRIPATTQPITTIGVAIEIAEDWIATAIL